MRHIGEAARCRTQGWWCGHVRASGAGACLLLLLGTSTLAIAGLPLTAPSIASILPTPAEHLFGLNLSSKLALFHLTRGARWRSVEQAVASDNEDMSARLAETLTLRRDLQLIVNPPQGSGDIMLGLHFGRGF